MSQRFRREIHGPAGHGARPILRALLAGTLAAVGVVVATPARSLPLSPLLTYEVLTTDATEPMAIEVADDGRVIWIERQGAVNVWFQDGSQVEAARIPVSANLCPECVTVDPEAPEEGGLYGLLLSSDFNQTGKLYLYYSVPFSKDPVTQLGIFRLSAFILDPATSTIDLATEETIFEVEIHYGSRVENAHHGGDLVHLPDGTILLSTGDNIGPEASQGYGPRDARTPFTDGEVTVANPADLRGKILRMMPDGSLPDGSQPGVAANPYIGQSHFNPYIEENSIADPLRPWVRSDTGTDIPYNPYVYAMGFKQPFKGAVNPYTGHVFYADVGPDGSSDDPDRGPRGHDERNTIPPGGGGFYGWPRCLADNKPYTDVDWTTGATSGPLDCSEMTPATFWYPKDASTEWPSVGSGGTTGLPVDFYRADQGGALRLPVVFDDTVIDLEWSRNWLATFGVNDDGTLNTDSFERWDPLLDASGAPVNMQSPIDGNIGPDGALYIAEYGTGFYVTIGAKIARVRCFGCTPDPADYVVEDAPAQPGPTPPAQPDPSETQSDDTSGLPATGGGMAVLALTTLALLAALRRQARLV